ncbi:uncharacterized protein [Panulirus ornatus]|uniref:uncharacterized protein n=1 Tax=Panulirus ornatus TaxID=150431 RepID=UPI003A88DA01
MEYIQIVQRPAYSHRPYGAVRSPYTDHPGCSVLCNHPTAPHTHRNLLNLTRASWLQEVRAHMTRAGATQIDADGDTGDRRTPSSMPFTPLGTEGLQVNIPEEFLAKFARSDSRPDSPAPTLLVHTSRLAPFRRCVTPDTLEPVRRPRHHVLRRSTSLPNLATGRTAHTFMPTGRVTGRRKQGRLEADFTTKLSKQLNLVAKGQHQKQQQQQQQQQQQNQREQNRQQQVKKGGSRAPRAKLKAQDSEDSGVGGEKRPARRRPRRGGKKKGEEGGLDDPGQTAVSTVGDSRVGSSRRSGSSHSSKPTSARSSKSSSSHRRLHDPLSYDPKEFLGANNPPEDGSELAKLQEALGPGVGGATLTEAEVFWFSLPRSPSHRAAVFTLPVQITRLLGMSSIDYLRKYMRLRTSRRQLYSMVFTRHRDLESIRVERMLTSDFGEALGNALGGSVTKEQLTRLSALVTLPDLALDRDYFILISAFAERLFCYELLAAPDVQVEPRDLVEQLDFKQLDERLEGVTLDQQLHQLLTTIRDLG